MFPLSIKDIREWMIENRSEYRRLEKEEFKSLTSAMRWLYVEFRELLDYYSCVPECEHALHELVDLLQHDREKIIEWVRKYEQLGAKKLLLFEVLYLDWEEEVSDEHLKVQKDIYIERKPFKNLLCFCSVFSYLYWECEVHLAARGELDAFVFSHVRNRLYTSGYRLR